MTSNHPSRPNIILIMSDDMGYSDLGCYGSEIQTPVLDSLATNGLRFTQFYNSARCCPTRASLLTGVYPHQAGIGAMTSDDGIEGYRGDLSTNCMTIAEVLKGAGYATYMSGKWHVTNHLWPETEDEKYNWPRQRGFDRFYGTILGAGSFWDPATLVRDNRHITPMNDPEYQPEAWFYTDAISDNAVKYIREHNSDDPFFMYVAYTAAHWPMQAPDKDIARYKGKYDDGFTPIRQARYRRMKELGVIEEQWGISPQAGEWDAVANKAWEARNMEVYAAMVDNMDQGIGRIVSELKGQGKLENTLIFFLEDNGACAEPYGRGGIGGPRADKPTLSPMGTDELQTRMIPEQTRDGYPVRQGVGTMAGAADTYVAYGRGWANVSNTPFREYKHWVHEGGISTPLIVHWPERVKDHGKLRHTPAHLIDIMSTCVDVSGAAYPNTYKDKAIKSMEGLSLVPVFNDRPLDRETLYFEHEGNCAMRMGKWKLVGKKVLDNDNVKEEGWELYDMEKDRSELHDLAAEHPQRIKEMVAQFTKYCWRANVLPRPQGKKGSKTQSNRPRKKD